MAVTVNVPVDSITVGERRREEYGAVDDLAQSMRTYGLLHPVVIDIERKLVAGGRRLAAAKLLGWQQIPARMLDALTPAELREIELEENLQRKDLTGYERDKNLVELAEAAAEIEQDNCSNLEQLGPREQPGSLRRVAERIGRAPSEIVRAKQHVAAVEAHPILKEEPQSTAIDYAKAVQREPALVNAGVAKAVEHYRSQLANRREQAKEERATSDRLMSVVGDPDGKIATARLIGAFSRAVHASFDLTSLKPDALAAVLDDEHVESAHDTIRRLREWCDGMERALPPGLRLVKGE